MKLGLRIATMAASVVARAAATGSMVALAASTTPASHSAATCCWDHRGHRDFDRSRWEGRGWDHRGWGWNWERQCDWAFHHDRDWYDRSCG